jgi:hypothetical protein
MGHRQNGDASAAALIESKIHYTGFVFGSVSKYILFILDPIHNIGTHLATNAI